MVPSHKWNLYVGNTDTDGFSTHETSLDLSLH